MSQPGAASVRNANGYCGIDLVKFLCTFLVVAIHYPPFSQSLFPSAHTLNLIVSQAIGRIAVPFFFMSTGFFLLGTDDGERVVRYCTKLLRLLGVWTTILILGTHHHLWYLRATVVAVVCVSFCLRRMRLLYAALLALVLYAIGLLGDSYYGCLEPLRSFGPLDSVIVLYERIFEHTRKGPFMGFPFVLMGAWFARTGFAMKPARAGAGLAAALVLLVGEALLLDRLGISKANNMYLMLLPVAFFLFALATSLRLKPRPVYIHMRSVGTMNYCAHVMVAKVVAMAFDAIDGLTGINLDPWLYPVVVTASLLTVTGVYCLSLHKRFTWLKYLYR